MTDQIPADKVREIIARHRDGASHRGGMILNDLKALLPLPTLADMTEEERAACQWMQADIIGGDEPLVIAHIERSDGTALILDRNGRYDEVPAGAVTPRPDLPRMEWPGDKKPASALPDGWRLADHPDYGRVIVTNPTPDSGGYVYFVHRAADRMGCDWHRCDPDELTYIDSPATKGDGTPTGPGHLAVGTVIESADDPRIAALPEGSVLLDCDGEAVAKRHVEWVGIGYIPIPSEGAEFGPWTVLRIPKEDDQ